MCLYVRDGEDILLTRIHPRACFRFKNQILYGCQNAECNTPTCASFRRRVSDGPYRRYTELSARTLACYLASLDNATDGLCRNPPKGGSDLSAQEHSGRKKRLNRTSHAQLSADAVEGDNEEGEEEEKEEERALEAEAAGPESSDHVPVQRTKDPKSFTQNLFDTLSMRMVEWLPLRRSPEKTVMDFDNSQVYSDLESSSARQFPRSPKHPKATADGSASIKGAQPTPPRRVGNNNPQTPSSQIGSSMNASVEVRPLNQHVKRMSIAELDHWRQSPRPNFEQKARQELKPAHRLSMSAQQNQTEFSALNSPPALKQRPQKHTGKVGGLSERPLRDQKKHRRVSWDGAKVLNEFERLEKEHGPAVSGTPQQPPRPVSSKRQDLDTEPENDDEPLFTTSVHTVSHFSREIVDGLGQILVGSEEDAERWSMELSQIEQTGSFDELDWRFSTPRQRQAYPFVAQSVFYVLSNSKSILQSFRKLETDSNASKRGAASTQLDVQQLEESLRQLFTFCPWEVALHALWNVSEKLFVAPVDLSQSVKSSRRSSRASSSATSGGGPVVTNQDARGEKYMSDASAARIATIVLFALVSAVPKVDARTWRGILKLRASGTVAPGVDMQQNAPLGCARSVIDVTDRFEHELALRLVNRLVRAITARLTFFEISKSRQIYTHDSPKQRKNSVLDLIIDYLGEYCSAVNPRAEDRISSSSSSISALTVSAPGAPTVIVEWLRTVFLKEWDGKPEIFRSSSPGGVVQILATMYKERGRLGLMPEDFHTPFLSERLDPMDMPVEWLGSMSNNRTLHLLSHSFLFPPSALVIYFRALNHSTMSKYYEAAMTTTKHVMKTAFSAIRVHDDVALMARLKTSMSTYLVLVVRRSDVLTDALNQLWRRERRELMRPLKVQMGMDEGEEGVDHGGVQQEFFRVAMAESLDPNHGMFTTDSRTRISWIQPCSLEPLYKFELLGLLFSLAIYNGLTLPVNFPVALYRKLLGLKVKHLDHIRDGWPELTRGLEGLLAWEDGDVGDVFMRTYEFSFEVFGSVVTVDMQNVGRDAAWPASVKRLHGSSGARNRPDKPRHASRGSQLTPESNTPTATYSVDAGAAADSEGKPSTDKPCSASTVCEPAAEEAALVTNSNRSQFVKDYIFWLTDKSIRPQYEAFARGFYTCLDRTALSIFTPEALKLVVEGHQEIDIDELERYARYEGGFEPSHRVIRDFWSVVRRFSAEQKAQLLEFVTASDRVPVNGIASIMFVIQKNGVGDTVWAFF